MALLTLGLGLSTYVTVYLLMSALSADIVRGLLMRARKMEGVTRTDATVKTTEDNMYSLEIHRGKNAKEYCNKNAKGLKRFNRYYYVELFYRDLHLDSFCSVYRERRLLEAVMYYCHAVKPGVNVHVFHIDYAFRLDPDCVTVRYSLDPAPSVPEAASCYRTRAYQMQSECLALNGWSSSHVTKALRYSIYWKALENKPLGVKKWIPKK